jgi:hypothetical protein
LPSTAHTYEQHVRLDPAVHRIAGPADDITLFCQDWGGVIGLRIAGDMPERFQPRRRRQHHAADPPARG